MPSTYDVVVTMADGQELFVVVATDKESAESAWNDTVLSLARGQNLRLIRARRTAREMTRTTIRSVTSG